METPKDRLIRGAGKRLRKVPGLGFLLDARAHEMWRRAEARQAESREAAVRVNRARDNGLLQELAARGGMRINVGSGPSSVEGWVNVDIQPDWEDVLYMDVTEPWPVPAGSVEAINSEHFIEHIAFADAPKYFAESFRVLRPGGVIRTSTPGLREAVETYLEDDQRMLELHQKRIVGWCEAHDHSEWLNNTFYEWGHRHIYDEAALVKLLEEAGFAEIEGAEFGQSRHEQLRGIDTHDDGPELRHLTLALDAVKPG
jgi:predicted SAM-dependent methyltransferase